jgi:hypothetical protein
MPRGDKSKYTDKQERKADHIAESYEKRGVSEKEAERRAWATVNKATAAARNPAPAVARIQVIRQPTKAGKPAARHPLRDQTLSARLRLRKPPPRASATPSIMPIVELDDTPERPDSVSANARVYGTSLF